MSIFHGKTHYIFQWPFYAIFNSKLLIITRGKSSKRSMRILTFQPWITKPSQEQFFQAPIGLEDRVPLWWMQTFCASRKAKCIGAIYSVVRTCLQRQLPACNNQKKIMRFGFTTVLIWSYFSSAVINRSSNDCLPSGLWTEVNCERQWQPVGHDCFLQGHSSSMQHSNLESANLRGHCRASIDTPTDWHDLKSAMVFQCFPWVIKTSVTPSNLKPKVRHSSKLRGQDPSLFDDDDDDDDDDGGAAWELARCFVLEILECSIDSSNATFGWSMCQKFEGCNVHLYCMFCGYLVSDLRLNFGSLRSVWASIGNTDLTKSLFLTGASLRDVVAGFLNVNNSNMSWPQSDLGLSYPPVSSNMAGKSPNIPKLNGGF